MMLNWSDSSVKVAHYRGTFGGAVHSFAVTTGPWMVGLGASMLDTVLAVYLVDAEHMETRRPVVTIFRESGELGAPFKNPVCHNGVAERCLPCVRRAGGGSWGGI